MAEAVDTAAVRAAEKQLMDERFGPRERLAAVAASVPPIRTFDTGATRDADEGKHDYEGFLSPLVIDRFGQYMHKHRVQADGTLRDSDNWQKGIPAREYMRSLWRHFMDLWLLYRGYRGRYTQDVEEALCGILFNTMGFMHEWLKRSVVQKVLQRVPGKVVPYATGRMPQV